MSMYEAEVVPMDVTTTPNQAAKMAIVYYVVNSIN